MRLKWQPETLQNIIIGRLNTTFCLINKLIDFPQKNIGLQLQRIMNLRLNTKLISRAYKMNNDKILS